MVRKTSVWEPIAFSTVWSLFAGCFMFSMWRSLGLPNNLGEWAIALFVTALVFAKVPLIWLDWKHGTVSHL